MITLTKNIHKIVQSTPTIVNLATGTKLGNIVFAGKLTRFICYPTQVDNKPENASLELILP